VEGIVHPRHYTREIKCNVVSEQSALPSGESYGACNCHLLSITSGAGREYLSLVWE